MVNLIKYKNSDALLVTVVSKIVSKTIGGCAYGVSGSGYRRAEFEFQSVFLYSLMYKYHRGNV